MAKMDAILETYAENQRSALADVKNIKNNKNKDELELFSRTLEEEARSVLNETDKKCSDWVRESFKGKERRQVIGIIVRAMRGNAPLTTDLLANHLKLSEKQQELIDKLVSDQSRFRKKIFETNGIEGLRKPSAFVTNTFASHSARLYDILEEPQMDEFLFLSGSVSEGEGVSEFLTKMPEETRMQLIRKSDRLARIWKDTQSQWIAGAVRRISLFFAGEEFSPFCFTLTICAPHPTGSLCQSQILAPIENPIPSPSMKTTDVRPTQEPK